MERSNIIVQKYCGKLNKVVDIISVELINHVSDVAFVKVKGEKIPHYELFNAVQLIDWNINQSQENIFSKFSESVFIKEMECSFQSSSIMFAVRIDRPFGKVKMANVS